MAEPTPEEILAELDREAAARQTAQPTGTTTPATS